MAGNAASSPVLRRADQFAAIVASSEDAILTKDREAVITSWNPAAETIYGYTDTEAIGRPISMLVPEHLAGEEREILDRILTGGRVDHYETERVTKDGRLIFVSLSVSPLRDDDGAVVGASVIARDITDRHRSRELASRLATLTSALSREISRERTVETLLEQAVGALGADAGTLGLLDRSHDEIVLSGTIGHSTEAIAAWERFPLQSEVPMSVAVRSGEPIWTTSPEELKTKFPSLTEAPVRFASLAVIPLLADGSAFGAVSLSFATARTFDPEERSFLLAAAQQAAQTLENARLYESQRLANERLAFLAAASEVLAGSLDPDGALQRVAELAVERIADWCGIEMLDEHGELRNVAVAHADPERVRLARDLRSRYPVDPTARTGVPRVIRTGRSELYPEISEAMLVEAAQDPQHLRLMRELGLVSVMIVPLEARGKVLGALTLVAAESGRHFDQSDLELAEDLARRAGLAIDNAMAYRREHEAAVVLQRSLLPETLPEIDGIEFAVRYQPAAPGLEVGGDWYEVVAVDDGSVAAIIGDVAGRGIDAASIMGRVRPALRTLVLAGHHPAEAIGRLDALIKESDSREMITVFHLRYEPGRQTAEYVRAGHPPALLRLPDGSVEELAGAGTPPLGILDALECHSHEVRIPPGSLLLLYTDGLIERRGKSLTEGLEWLKETFARAPASAEASLEWLAEAFTVDAIPDDVAMLAIATASD